MTLRTVLSIVVGCVVLLFGGSIGASARIPVRIVHSAQTAYPPDLVTRYLASPIVVLARDAHSVAEINTMNVQYSSYSVTIEHIYRDVQTQMVERYTALVEEADPVLGSPGGPAFEVIRSVWEPFVDHSSHVLLYLRRDSLGTFVPVDQVWGVIPLSSRAAADEILGKTAREGHVSRAERSFAFDRALLRSRGAVGPDQFDAYLKSLVLCPEYTYDVLYRSQRSAMAAKFANWASECGQLSALHVFP